MDPRTLPLPVAAASERWSERTGALLDSALELSGEADLDVLLPRAVELAVGLVDARYGALALYDADGTITRFAHHGVEAERIGRLPTGRGLLGEDIVAQGPLRLDDLSCDHRSFGFPPGHPPMRSFLGVPLARAGRHFGNLYLTERDGGAGFDEGDEALTVALAAFAASAVENALRLEAERSSAGSVAARAAADERGRVSAEIFGKVIRAQEAERARVARDLHDDVGQALTSVLLGLRLVESALGATPVDVEQARARVADLRSLVTDALDRTRRLAFDLRPTVLDDIGLIPALERLSSDLSARSGVSVALTDALSGGERLAPETETVVYRFVQEALTNVVRHADAASVEAVVSRSGDVVRATVSDDGRGFDITAPRHLGLEGMVERARLVGGTVEIGSTPGAGTTVVLEVPVG